MASAFILCIGLFIETGFHTDLELTQSSCPSLLSAGVTGCEPQPANVFNVVLSDFVLLRNFLYTKSKKNTGKVSCKVELRVKWWAGKLAQWVKGPGTKLHDLSSITRSHIHGGGVN